MESVCDVVIVGAGPVGLTAALCCASHGIPVIICEKNATRPLQSRAIGITPPSMALFDRLGCSARFAETGVLVSRALGCTSTRILGKVSFSGLKTRWPFIVSIPQHLTESILESEVMRSPLITYLPGIEALRATRDSSRYSLELTSVSGPPHRLQPRFIIACDGSKSGMRATAGIAWKGAAYRHTFLMADYIDRTNWGDEARLFFTGRGSVESFPLPGKKRRFVLRTPRFIKENETDFLEKEIPLRCGAVVNIQDKVWESAFGVQHFIAAPFSRDGLFLCGDAAHVMSPIGGQNMNIGFADAECAVWCIRQILANGVPEKRAESLYNRFRPRAARHGTLRSEIMMRCGTSGGLLWHAFRSLMTAAALNSPLRNALYNIFTMLSLPAADFAGYRNRLERALSA